MPQDQGWTIQRAKEPDQGGWTIQPVPTNPYDPESRYQRPAADPEAVARMKKLQQLGFFPDTVPRPEAAPETGEGPGAMAIEALGQIGPMAGEAGAEAGGWTISKVGGKGPKAQGIARGVGRFVGSTVGDPVNLSMMGGVGAMGAIGRRLAALGFSGLMAKGAVQESGLLGSIWDRSDIPQQEKVELITDIILNAGTAGLAGSHSLRPRTPAPNLESQYAAEISRLGAEAKQQIMTRLLEKQKAAEPVPRAIGKPEAKPQYAGVERRSQDKLSKRIERDVTFADANQVLREAKATGDAEQIQIAQQRLYHLRELYNAENFGKKVFIPSQAEPLRDPSQSGAWTMLPDKIIQKPTVPEVPVPLDPAQLLRQLSIFDTDLTADQKIYRNYIERTVFSLGPQPKLRLSPRGIQKAAWDWFDVVRNNAQAMALLDHVQDPKLRDEFIVSALDRIKAGLMEMRKKGISEPDLYAVRANYPQADALKRAEEILGRNFEKFLPEDKKLSLKGFPMIKPAESRAPKSIQAGSRSLYRVPGARILAAYLRLPKSRLANLGEAAISERSIFIQDYDYITNRFLKDVQRFMDQSGSAHDLDIEKLGYALQGDLDSSELTPAGREILSVLRGFMEQQDEMLRRAYGDDIPLQDGKTYLTQIWNLDEKPEVLPRAYSTLMRDRFLKARTIDSYKQGIEMGLTPKHRNVLDVIRVRARYASRAIANQTFAYWLESQLFIASEAKAQNKNLTGYVPAEDTPALEKAAYGGTTKKVTKRGTEKTVTLYKRPVLVHPDLKLAVDTIFQSPLQNIGFATLDTIRAVSKKAVLGGSFFHHIVLSEQQSALGLGNLKLKMALKGAGGLGFPFNPELAKGFRDGLIEVFPRSASKLGLSRFKGEGPVWRWKPEAIRDAIQHGLNLNSEEVESAITQVLREAGTQGALWEKIVTAPLRGIGNASQIMEKGLWEYLHQGQMLEAYFELTGKELGKLGKEATPEQVAELKREISEHINKAFGAVSFERMSITPKGRQVLNWLLLAPAWTYSNLMLGLSALKRGSIGGTLARRWAVGAAISWFVTTQMLNYALSSWYNRHGKVDPNRKPDQLGQRGWFTWENHGAPEELGDPLGVTATQLPVNEHWSDIYAGVNPDGTERYIRFGKAFREPFRWLMSPLQTAGEKMSPAAKGPIIALTGSSPGSGFRFFDPRKREGGARRLAGIADMFMPFFLQDAIHQAETKAAPGVFPERRETTQFFSQPTAIGITKERATDALALAYERKDPRAQRMIIQAAARNHLKVHDIVRAAKLAYIKKLKRGMLLPRIQYSPEGQPSVVRP